MFVDLLRLLVVWKQKAIHDSVVRHYNRFDIVCLVRGIRTKIVDGRRQDIPDREKYVILPLKCFCILVMHMRYIFSYIVIAQLI